jgi:hypothetical protein
MRLAILALVAGTLPALSQESGWTYSPFPGEGDRAAIGCSYGSTPDSHSCVVVRCEDDFTVGLHIKTTRPGGDAGAWRIQVDKDIFEVEAVAVDGSPYGARVAGEVSRIIDSIRNGDSLFIDPRDSREPPSRGIGLAGSLRATTQALFFCAPRNPEAGTDESPG